MISYKCNFSLRDYLMWIKLYTDTVYNLRMCMNEDNPDPK